MRIGGEQDVLSRIGSGATEGLKIGALRVNARGGREGRDLVGEQAGAGNRVLLPGEGFSLRIIDNGYRLRARERIGSDLVGPGGETFRLPSLFSGNDFLVILRDLHRWVQVLQPNGNQVSAERAIIRGRLNSR